MKKISPAIFIISILILTACKKNTPAAPSYPGGSWTFNATTFSATACDSAGASLAALDSLTGNPNCNLTVYFNSALPVTSGSYTVAGLNARPAAGQVSISVGYVAPGELNNYISTGGNGTQKVNVTLANGKVNISGIAIEMVNIGLGADSSGLTFNITQTR